MTNETINAFERFINSLDIAISKPGVSIAAEGLRILLERERLLLEAERLRNANKPFVPKPFEEYCIGPDGKPIPYID